MAAAGVIAVAGCGPARQPPTEEARRASDALADALRAVPTLTEVDARVTTHVYTAPSIVATATIAPEPDREALIVLGHQIRPILEQHQVPGHQVTIKLRSTVEGAQLGWSWRAIGPTTPSIEDQVDAVLAEITRGATSATHSDDLSSRWDRLDDTALLHPAPRGLRVVHRWASLPRPAGSLTIAIHVGEQAPPVPLVAALGGLLTSGETVNLVVLDGAARWKLLPGRQDGDRVGQVAAMLRALRSADASGRQTVEITGWWVTVVVADRVEVQQWRSDDDRARSGGTVDDLLGRING